MRSFLALAGAAILGVCGIAHADTINTFNLNETYGTGSATGTVTVDATTGKVTGSNISYTSTFGNAAFTGTPTSTSAQATYDQLVFTSSTPGVSLTLFLPVSSLVNYNGGSVCTTGAPCSSNISNIALAGLGATTATAGTLTLTSSVTPPPPAAVTPEPSSLLLLGTGILGIGGMMRRRFV